MIIKTLILKAIVGLLALCGTVSVGRFGQRVIQTQLPPRSEERVASTAIHPVVIIGSGPAGLAAAKTIVEEGDVPVIILEGKQSGGPLNAWTPVRNWPGKGFTSGNFIITDLRAEVEALPNVRFVARSIESVDFSGSIHSLHLDNGEIVQAQTVIITMGTRYRCLTVPGAQEYAHSISYDQSPSKHEKKGTCVIIGGGMDAMRKTVYRLRSGARVILLVRGSRLAVGLDRVRITQDYVDNGQLTILYGTEVTELIGDGNTLTGVRLSNGDTVSVDHVAVGMGRVPNSSIFAGQLELDSDGYIVLKNHSQETSRAGIFAAGDITSVLYAEGAIAAGDGMKAGKDVVRYLID